MFTTQEPCAMCVGALLEARVRALVYAVADERQERRRRLQLARAPGMPHQISVVSGVREDEARRLGTGHRPPPDVGGCHRFRAPERVAAIGPRW